MLPPLQLALLRAYALHLLAEIGNTDTDDAQYLAINVTATLDDNTTSVTGNRYLPANPIVYTYDADGNLLTDGRWSYAWDAENRLIQLVTADDAVTAGVAKQKIVFSYDDQGRKMRKQVYHWNDGWADWADVPDVDVRYVYDGQNLVAELDGKQETPALERAYVWGPSYLPGGGPVGGLLLALLTDSWGDQKVVNYSYDANGNVKELTGEFGDVFGSYDYDPFGKLVQVSGSWAAYNPMRFSTKYAETDGLRSGVPLGLDYYGARFYKPDTGRFLNRDPMEEAGGLNLYAFCHNDGVNLVDPDGMCTDAFGLGALMAANGFNPLDPTHVTMATATELIETEHEQDGLLCPDGSKLTANNADNQGFGGGSARNNESNPLDKAAKGIGGAGAVTGGVENVQNGSMGFWVGKNGKAYSTDWGGNGATGGRLSYAGEMAENAHLGGSALGVLGIGVSAAQGFQAYQAGNTTGVVQAGADIGVGVAGTWGGPIGWAFSVGYFGGQMIDNTFGVTDTIADWYVGPP